MIDSQSVRAADTVPKASRGWDNAKKVNGRKRHIAVDSAGLVLAVVITAASVQDRDGPGRCYGTCAAPAAGVRLIWADAGYAGKLAAWAAAMKMTIQIVARRETSTSLRSCPAAGSSSGPSPGSASTAAPSGTTRTCPAATKPWSCGP